MKKFVLYLTFASPPLSACGDDADAVKRTFTVASVRPAATSRPIPGTKGCISPVYILREEGGAWRLWCRWYPIHGFGAIYEEGYEYEIEVLERYIPDPPLDVPERCYELIRVVSKIRKDSEDIPAWMLTGDEK